MDGSARGKRPNAPSAPVDWDVCALPVGKRPNAPPGEVDWDVCRPGGCPTARAGLRTSARAGLRTSARGGLRSSAWPDRAISRIATRQHGLITRRQLTALGIRRGTIDRALARGRVIALHRGVYALGHLALSPLATPLAAVLAVGDGAVLSHRAALVLWSLVAAHEGAGVHVTVVGRDAGRRRAGIRVHRAIRLDNRDHTTRHGIPVTSPARTLLDVAPAVSERELERAYDDALKQRLVTRHAVVELLSRAPDRPAADRLGRLAHGELGTTTVTRSQLEERFLGLIRRAGLPLPEVNAQLGPFTVDFLWAGQRLIVELDGYAFHSTRRSFEGDRARDLELGAAGFQVMRFTWRQLVEQPELVLARLTQRLTALQVQSGR